MSRAGLNALKRSCCPIHLNACWKKTQSFCPCSRALNRSGKGLIFLATCRLPVAEYYRHTDLLMMFFSLYYLHEVIITQLQILYMLNLLDICVTSLLQCLKFVLTWCLVHNVYVCLWSAYHIFRAGATCSLDKTLKPETTNMVSEWPCSYFTFYKNTTAT
jgi:hypothetical protein